MTEDLTRPAPLPPGWLRPLQPLGRAVLVLLAVTVAVDIVAVIDDHGRRDLFGRVALGASLTVSEAESSDRQTAVIGSLQLALLVLTGVLTLVWLHRAYVNAGRLGSELPHRPGWAVWSWFVPVLNLVRPRRIIDQTWRASDPALPAWNAVAWSVAPTTPLILLWWLLFLFNSLLAQVASAQVDSVSAASVRDGYAVMLASDALDAVVAVLFAVIVWRLTARQTARIAARAG